MSPQPSVVVSLPGADWIAEVGPIAGVEFVESDLRSIPERGDEVEVCVPPYMQSYDPSVFGRLPRLRLVQVLTAGYDGVPEALPAGVQLANASGVHDTSTAEMAMALTLAAQRGIPQFVRDAEHGRWGEPRIHDALADRRVVILGYGAIGRALAARLLPFEVDLAAVASRARPGDGTVPEVHGIEELKILLPHTDVLIVVVPLSERTLHLVNDEVLSALPDGALVVNVARGKVIDSAAILRHAWRLRFALDVTDPEPLPSDHPLWAEPTVLISPHTGGPTTAFRPRAVRLLREQLLSYARTGSVRNVVAEGDSDT